MRVARAAVTRNEHHRSGGEKKDPKVVPLSEEEQRNLVIASSKKMTSGMNALFSSVKVQPQALIGSAASLVESSTRALEGVSKSAVDGTGDLFRKTIALGAGGAEAIGGLTNLVGSVNSAAEQALREELEDQMEKMREAAEATNPARMWRKLVSDVDERMQSNENDIDTTGLTGWQLRYIKLTKLCRAVLDTSQWTVFIFGCIVIAGLMVGLLTYESFAQQAFTGVLENVILAAFILEIIMKVIAEGFTPWTYFTNHEWKWNWLDFMVVLFSLPVPYGGQTIVKMFRLLRLLRFSRMVNEVPNLKLIISGLISSLNFVSYIVLLWFMIIYIYALLAIQLFGENDPFHFKTIEMAVVTLFQITVMDVSAHPCQRSTNRPTICAYQFVLLVSLLFVALGRNYVCKLLRLRGLSFNILHERPRCGGGGRRRCRTADALHESAARPRVDHRLLPVVLAHHQFLHRPAVHGVSVCEHGGLRAGNGDEPGQDPPRPLAEEA
jgi:hypothetical protein